MTQCPYCKEKMKEVNREDSLKVSDDRFASIDIVFHCPKCGKEPLMRLEFEGFYDEDDNPITERAPRQPKENTGSTGDETGS